MVSYAQASFSAAPHLTCHLRPSPASIPASQAGGKPAPQRRTATALHLAEVTMHPHLSPQLGDRANGPMATVRGDMLCGGRLWPCSPRR